MPDDDVTGTAPVGERAGETEEDQIAAGHEGGRQPVVGDFDGRFARERRIGDGGQRIDLDDVIIAQPCLPIGLQRH